MDMRQGAMAMRRGMAVVVALRASTKNQKTFLLGRLF